MRQAVFLFTVALLVKNLFRELICMSGFSVRNTTTRFSVLQHRFDISIHSYYEYCGSSLILVFQWQFLLEMIILIWTGDIAYAPEGKYPFF